MKKYYRIMSLALLAATTLSLSLPLHTHAAELSAIELQQNCAETEKGFLGQKFDSEKSDICKGYMMGFFDSMIVSDQLSGKQQFCIPRSLPKTQNTLILNEWVQNNRKIAESTTAAVALFAAYTKTFPCK